MAAGVVQIPWYATGFRADQLADELERISAVSLRYGATGYSVYRARDDRYKFLQILHFDDKLAWERYWEGPEFIDFRVACSGWYQVPVLYGWHDVVADMRLPEVATDGARREERVVEGESP
jgi:hypothetical protein